MQLFKTACSFGHFRRKKLHAVWMQFFGAACRCHFPACSCMQFCWKSQNLESMQFCKKCQIIAAACWKMAPACSSACSSKKLHPNCVQLFPSKMTKAACSFEKLLAVLKTACSFYLWAACRTACSFAKSIKWLDTNLRWGPDWRLL